MTEPLAALFNAVRNRRELERLEKAQKEAQQRERTDQEKQEKKERDDDEFETILFVTELQRQIAELEERMARNFEILRGTCGDDVIGGMAATWLSREEAASLTTDDERLQALSKKFLNEDDTIKPPYVDLVEAHYVRDWSVVDKLKNGPSEPAIETATAQPESRPGGAVPF